MDSKEFTGITRASFDAFKKQSGEAADSFTVERMGVKVSVDYTEASQTVKVTIVSKPDYIPESMVWSFVEQNMKSAG